MGRETGLRGTAVGGHDIAQEHEIAATEAAERRERLLYLADMVSELKRLAARDGCDTLSTLLALSHAEAMGQANGKSCLSHVD